MYNHFISTKFEKHVVHDGILQGRYSIMRKNGCILSQFEVINNDKIVTIVDIEFMSYIYKVVLENDDVCHIYNMTKLTELVTP